MVNPAVLLLSLSLGSVFSVTLHAETVDFAGLQQATRRPCNGMDVRHSYGESLRRTWDMIKGNESTGTGGRSCADRAKDAEECCKQAGANENLILKCQRRFRLAAAIPGTNATNGDGPDIFPDTDPFDDSQDGEGLREDMTEAKKNLLRASRRSDRMAGMCKALAQACLNSCGTDASNKPKCQEADQNSKKFCENASTNFVKAHQINPNLAGPGTGPSGNNPGGNNPGGNNPPPTQKPQSAGGGNPMDGLMKALQAMNQQQDKPKDPQQEQQLQTCEQNPALAGCPVKKAEEDDSWNKKKAKADFEGEDQGTDTGGDNFNVANNDARTPEYAGNGEKTFGTPASTTAVPNGGGQMPGGQGGGGAGGTGGAANPGFVGASRAATDIMRGMMSGGGYSQMNAAMQMQNGGNGGGFSSYGTAPGGEFKPGMDLRQFLPGGKSDPTRKLAGGAASFQIQPQTVNIWSRISERIKARCSQGLLRDCN